MFDPRNMSNSMHILELEARHRKNREEAAGIVKRTASVAEEDRIMHVLQQ
ncbi:MAG: hypothetical protein ACJ71R_12055 [Nitrososphaeraceae archaeon]